MMNLNTDFSSTAKSVAIPLFIALGICYATSLVLYRLYLSPLSKFPGPRVAAATGWYEAYFELVHKGGGRFLFEIRRMHEVYARIPGPIVRINPYELHIADPAYYSTLYTSTLNLDKASHIQHRFNAPTAAFSTPQHALHKRRRAAISPFFAKRRIDEQAPMINSHVDVICRRLNEEYASTDKVLCVNELYGSYVTDVIMTYAFNRCPRFLEEEEFISAFGKSIQGLKEFVHWAQQFPFLPRILGIVPPALMGALFPAMRASLVFQEEMRTQAQTVLSGHGQKGTIFADLLASDLPEAELTLPRLKDEAMSIVGAGIETTKTASVVTTFHILHTPRILHKLQAELDAAIPDPAAPPPLGVLEKLPFLAACIQEGIRLGYGATGRSPRISRGDPLTYGGGGGAWVIPAGVMVSMDSYHMHHDESVFHDSHAFVPERWLDGARGPGPDGNGRGRLNRYLASFGRGTRMCVGVNLAYAEITIVLARLFRGFEMELYHTSRRDVDCYRDLVGMEVVRGSRGVRVRVLKTRK
ncbi:cytochrome P450 [Aspergillus mulundensis]|uniref:Putative Cytochrome P450 n=1 Tax=Aspergillus mulundensis TaxID=1810919 RepID=A0A3D8RKF6_9EURO|nr:putative Cytochrome P450 [Aspergillus mulundensis]RDW74450.1 putative Cytochrome P450 [Aspergillus mulundensis]